jgi:hypothetical protein
MTPEPPTENSPNPIQQRILEASELLERLGFEEEQYNERSARVLLALCDLDPAEPWTSVSRPMLRTTDIIDWIDEHLGLRYKPNTRETIRRRTLHQFVDAGLVLENPDKPDRPTNSPKWCYQLSAEALEVLAGYGQEEFDQQLSEYKSKLPGLAEIYANARELQRIPVTLPNGDAITLSPGGQNPLIAQIINDFCEYYTPSGEVLYVGDADGKWQIFEREVFADLGVTFNMHGKMPDVVVYLRDKDWLLLIEAVSSHGPVDAKRHRELHRLFANSTAGLVFVTCFPDMRTFQGYANQISWETEVWCADNPTHLIHYNGERFLGPY